MDPTNIIQTILIFALPVLFAITGSSAAQAYAARYFGDYSAQMAGKLTLNPLKHIDPIGTILVPLLLYFATSGGFMFGYGKATPINYSNMRNPKRDMIWVSLSGPMANFLQAILWALMFVMLDGMGINERFFVSMAKAGVMVNLVMWAFNLFPMPPMAGGLILMGLLPWKQSQWLARIAPYGFFIMMGLFFLGVASTYWIQPLMSIGYSIINVLMVPFRALFTG